MLLKSVVVHMGGGLYSNVTFLYSLQYLTMQTHWNLSCYYYGFIVDSNTFQLHIQYWCLIIIGHIIQQTVYSLHTVMLYDQEFRDIHSNITLILNLPDVKT